jgi:hypothetical protein
MMLMLIDTREEPHGDDDRREPWIVGALRRVFPWPALVVWLFVAGQVLDGWWGAIALWAAIFVGTWRALRLLPDSNGMRDYHQ